MLCVKAERRHGRHATPLAGRAPRRAPKAAAAHESARDDGPNGVRARRANGGRFCRAARPARRSLLAATRSSPHLRANPYPEVTDRICRLPLPTLFYRPEAVHLGDLLRIPVRPDVKITPPPTDFQGPTPMHRTPREARRFTDATSLSLDKPIPGSPLLTKKRELFPGSTLASPCSVALPHWGPKARSPPSGSGILTRFPFDRLGVALARSLTRTGARARPRGTRAVVALLARARAGDRRFRRVRATATGSRAPCVSRLLPVRNGTLRSLRADSTMSNCCSHGTLLHFGLQSSRLYTCYYHQDLHRRRLHARSRATLQRHRRALLLVGAWHFARVAPTARYGSNAPAPSIFRAS